MSRSDPMRLCSWRMKEGENVQEGVNDRYLLTCHSRHLIIEARDLTSGQAEQADA